LISGRWQGDQEAGEGRLAQEPVNDRSDFGDKFAFTRPQQLLEVHRCGREDGVDRISGNALQPVMSGLAIA
jgi:hypothetical protein